MNELPDRIPALTIFPMWATLIMRGFKRVENRTWAPVQLRGPEARPLWVAIHAGSSESKKGVPEVARKHPHLADVIWGDHPRSVVLGVVRVRCALPVAQVDDPFAEGPWCWLIDRVVRLPRMRDATGRQGLWTLPPDINEACLHLVERAEAST